jgi:hypothetical protein
MFSKEQGFELALGKSSLNCPLFLPGDMILLKEKKGLSCSMVQLKPLLRKDMIVP